MQHPCLLASSLWGGYTKIIIVPDLGYSPPSVAQYTLSDTV